MELGGQIYHWNPKCSKYPKEEHLAFKEPPAHATPCSECTKLDQKYFSDKTQFRTLLNKKQPWLSYEKLKQYRKCGMLH